MLRIILDCDDVLYQTNEAALKRLNEKLGTAYTLGEHHKMGQNFTRSGLQDGVFPEPGFYTGFTCI